MPKGSVKKYKTDVLEELRRQLTNATEPAPAELTRGAVVHALGAEIRSLQKRGYSIQAIADLMTRGGVAISARVLRSHLGRPKGARKGPAKQPAGASTEVNQGSTARRLPTAPPATGVQTSAPASADTSPRSPSTANAPTPSGAPHHGPVRTPATAESPTGAKETREGR